MRPFLTAYWKNLIMANYEIEATVLRPYLPAGTELDFFNNTCYTSLVGFMFLETRIKGISIPYYTNFEEFNLRFYVRFKENEKWRRGVVFIKEIVPRKMISYIANIFYGEHYLYAPMKNSLKEKNDLFEIKYEWRFNKEWNFIEAVAEKKSSPAKENSEEEFITEHYWGYTKLTDNSTSVYEVVHPKWNIHKVVSSELFCDVKNMYGEKFTSYFKKPVSVFVADGSVVEVKNRKVIKFPF
jgi:uncharacterized protein YqjF (DUF2071 family)